MTANNVRLTANITTKAWLLVRSNPAKKDSIHYTIEDALRLQMVLALATPNRGPEKTEIHELSIDRDVCGVSFVNTSFTTSVGPVL